MPVLKRIVCIRLFCVSRRTDDGGRVGLKTRDQ